jgi:hypothetical protein
MRSWAREQSERVLKGERASEHQAKGPKLHVDVFIFQVFNVFAEDLLTLLP